MLIPPGRARHGSDHQGRHPSADEAASGHFPGPDNTGSMSLEDVSTGALLP